MTSDLPDGAHPLIESQSGVIARRQLLELGCGRGWVAHRLRRGEWRALHPGVYLSHNGPAQFPARLWGAILHVGGGALAARRTAGFLQGLVDDQPSRIELVVPAAHHQVAPSGVRLHRSREHEVRRHPAAAIPQVRLEHVVIDLASAEVAPDDVVGWLARACQRRLTTPERLRAALEERARVRHRALMRRVLADVDDGATSPLERRYLRDVERRHGLPSGTRQRRHQVAGRRQYSDVEYERYRVRVELDGLAYHPADQHARDAQRDNAALLIGDVTLRYGWAPVVGTPCDVALEVGLLLSRRGWSGRPVACSPTCTVPAIVVTEHRR